MDCGECFKKTKAHLFDILAFIAAFFTAPLFFYKLGQTSLVSWDEAWYGEIARNILKTDDVINLFWNIKPFTDHPPVGFWLMALSYKLFGVNEFWTRFPSALSGVACIILLYFLGKKLFNPLVGLLSGISLSSAIWFVYRSRSGNLDIFLTMFFLLTILLALKALEDRNYLYPFIASLILLFLTKTMVPFVILPVIFFIFFKNRLYKWHDLILPVIIFLTAVGGWFVIRIIQDHSFMRNYFGIGLRGVTIKSDYLGNLNLAKEYLHSSLGKWFWGGLLTLGLSVFLKQKRFLILIIFFVVFVIPIIFSPKIQIWHLIPLSPILILAYFGFPYVFLEKYFNRGKYQIYVIFIVFSSVIYFNQAKMIWYQFIDIPAFVSDEAILSKEAGKYPEKFMIDGDFVPTAIFYSGKNTVNQIQIEELAPLLKSSNDFLLITRKGSLINNKEISGNSYKILKEDRDKVLILHR